MSTVCDRDINKKNLTPHGKNDLKTIKNIEVLRRGTEDDVENGLVVLQLTDLHKRRRGREAAGGVWYADRRAYPLIGGGGRQLII